MSDLGFDVRGYCERLAKACPERFQVTKYAFDYIRWTVHDNKRPDAWFDMESEPRLLAMDLWAFFGPLCSELGIIDIKVKDNESLLECIIRTATERLEHP